jgi:hypothetical protein
MILYLRLLCAKHSRRYHRLLVGIITWSVCPYRFSWPLTIHYHDTAYFRRENSLVQPYELYRDSGFPLLHGVNDSSANR